MDWQSAFNVAAGLVGALGGWALRILWDGQMQLKKEVNELERRLPETYARRDDIRELTHNINQRFDRLEMLVAGREGAR
jgi:hypothetical protein